MTKKLIVVTAIAGVLAAAALARSDERSFDKKTLKAAGEGRALYLTHCAGCHGTDAHGGLTGTNHAAAPDLTLIAVRDGGFDRRHVALQIDGRVAPQVGMPCWGRYFASAPEKGEAWAATRVYLLTSYLDVVQASPSVPAVER